MFFISLSWVFASNDIKIISREEWWADETLRYLDSPEWVKILKDRAERAEKEKNTVYSQAQIDTYNIKQEKLKQMNLILVNEFWSELEYSTKIYTENWRKLAWPITKTKKIKGIVIHHTVNEYEDSFVWIKQMYKYHTLTKEWWDIWYNYLIWKNWEIFEWRAGWDYAIWAHDLRNNDSTIWISVIWDYSNKPININQYNSLKALTKYLIEKYDIDLTKKAYFHEECLWGECVKPLTSELLEPIIWHRQAWHTECPWEELYKQIELLKTDLLNDPVIKLTDYKKNIFEKLGKFSDQKLIDLLVKLEDDLEKFSNPTKLKVKLLLIDYFKYKNSVVKVVDENQSNIDIKTTDEIKIKLSYPDKDKIDIKSWTAIFNISRIGNNIYVKWKKFEVLTIPKKDPDSILEITSWNRTPLWDKEGIYNDNKFRWNLTVYAKDNKIVVVNSLNIEDYLKWLWEVSNNEVPVKIKTIIISARSYATWYTTNDRKFPWELYDWSDDPNEFQKYLWYGLEMRSPKINKLVDETRWKLITYNWKLIKPWYFSRSNWKTMSFYEYCKIRNSDSVCSAESKKYPFLQSVIDKWSEWETRLWHWVWISWAWVSYYAEKWWTYDMIIKYFLKWVDVL